MAARGHRLRQLLPGMRAGLIDDRSLAACAPDCPRRNRRRRPRRRLPPTPQNPQGVPPAIDDPRPPGSPGPVREPPRRRRRSSPPRERAGRRRASAVPPSAADRGAARPGLGQRRQARHPARPRRRRLSLSRPDGRLIRKAAELQRIRALAIPPAYEKVWICPRPNGHLQATGRDARGRKQYRYHPDWRLAQGRRQVRAHARVRRGAAAHQEARRRPTSRRRSAPRRAARRCWRRSSACSTRPWSGSATRNTRARTARSA